MEVGNIKESRCHQRPSLAPLSLALICGQFGYLLVTFVGPIKNELGAEFAHGTNMSFNEFEYFYGLMLTAYALPNFFMPCVAGALIDCVGANKVLMACSMMNVLGGLLQCLGILCLRDHVVLSGRLLIGFGNESLLVAAISLMGEVMPSDVIPFMQGMVGAGCFVAIAVGSLLAEPILQAGGRHGLCIFLCAAALVQLCGTLEALRQSNRFKSAAAESASSKIECDEMAPLMESGKTDLKVEQQSRCQHSTAWGSFMYAVTVFCSATNTICVWNLNMIICPLFLETWPAVGEPTALAEERAGAWSSFFMLVPAIGCPLVGAVCGALGCPGMFVFASQCIQAVGLGILSLAAHQISLSFGSGPLLPLLLISASNPLISPLLYQCITLTVPANHCAKAFGLMTAVQNVVMGLWPLLIAYLRVLSGSYRSGTVAFACVGLSGLVSWSSMLFLDRRSSTFCKRSLYFEELIVSRSKGI